MGVTQAIIVFSLNIGKLELTGAFSGGQTCELLFVRGTISFYNEKLQILPVGEGVMWNVSM